MCICVIYTLSGVLKFELSGVSVCCSLVVQLSVTMSNGDDEEISEVDTDHSNKCE